ncbi:lipase 3-like [Bradysia coprophila]|uniref:lipase 3-like n=1 Tax=Bradysia coprophila TaxID=38358 RepID=UPI00187D84DD|nr:lipase 3-like [Bradysia coprophila]
MYVKLFVLFLIYVSIGGSNTQNVTSDPDPILSIIKRDGYPAESYEVTTKDGYIISLHRIPPKMQTSKVVFLMHGMYVSAVDFLILGPYQNKALAYTLADAGYDVWLGNTRGNKFSKKHSTITPNDDEYWEFSWNEIGTFDLPAYIDHILVKTGQKSLHYVGHSQGTTVFFVMLSVFPEYNEKIRTFHGIGPVLKIKHPSPLAQFLANNADEIEEALTMFNIVEMPIGMSEAENGATMFCKDGTPFASLCGNLLFALVGKNRPQFNGTLLGPILKHTPAGMSYRQLNHYLQLINSKKFQFYDYKSEDNLMKYKSATPPEYETSNIKVKMQILYGTHDLLSTPQDVEDLIEYFGQHVIDVVKLNDWNHVDFVYGKEANKMVYQKIIEVMGKY